MKYCISCSAQMEDDCVFCPQCGQNQSLFPSTSSSTDLAPSADKVWGVLAYLSPLTMFISLIVYLYRLNQKSNNTEYIGTHLIQAFAIHAMYGLLIFPIYLILILTFPTVVFLELTWISLLIFCITIPVVLFLIIFQIIGIVFVIQGKNKRLPLFGHLVG